MDRNNTTGRLNLLSGERPGWQRLLIWGGIAFAALNILPLFILFFGNTRTSGVGTFILAAAAFVVISLPFGGLNLLRTWFNGARADFTRRDDPARGGYVYDVHPARASWLPLLALLPFGALFAVLWKVFPAVLICLVVAGLYVLPGARYRKRATIAVSPQGIESGNFNLPLDRIADLDVGNNGVKVSQDVLVAGRGGIPTAELVKRGLTSRQAERSYTLGLRGDGQSRAAIIAGGLTYDCAVNLQRDIQNAVARFSAAQ
jgi:hypothetical protein